MNLTSSFSSDASKNVNPKNFTFNQSKTFILGLSRSSEWNM